jgi:hypothetical protein
MNMILSYALAYLQAGLTVLPIEPGSKKAAVKWQVLQKNKPTEKQVLEWFGPEKYGLGLVCGRASAGLVVLDFDTAAEASYHRWAKLVPELTPFLPLVRTGKGLHVYARLPFEVRNVVLAQTPAGGVLIETRGEGGYVLAPPTLHPNGSFYEWANGFAHVPLLTARQGYKLLGACTQLHSCRQPEQNLAKSGGRDGYLVTTSAGSKLRKYAEGALRVSGEELGRVMKGGRNKALNRAAFNLGRFVGAGLLGVPEVEVVLRQACVRNGLIAEDGELAFERTLKSGLSAGVKLGLRR